MDLVDSNIVETARLQLLNSSKEIKQLEVEEKEQDEELPEWKGCKTDFKAAVLELEVSNKLHQN